MPLGAFKATVLGAAGSSGGAAGTLDVLYTTTLSTDTTTVSFSNVDSIASTYRTLVLHYFAVGGTSGGNWQDLLYSGTSHATDSNFHTHSWFAGQNMSTFQEYTYNNPGVAGGTYPSSADWYAQSAGGWIYFPNWQDDTMNRGALGMHSSSVPNSFSWYISAAIGSSGNTSGTTISIQPENGSASFYAGSHFTLCGLGGTE